MVLHQGVQWRPGVESGPHPTAGEGPVPRTATRTAPSRSPSEPGGGPRLRAMEQAASCPWEPFSLENRFLCVDSSACALSPEPR